MWMRGFTKPRADGLIDHALEAAAVDRELRNVVAGIEAARFAPDLLAETVGVGWRRRRALSPRPRTLSGTQNVRRDPLQISLFFSRKQGDFQEKQGGD